MARRLFMPVAVAVSLSLSFGAPSASASDLIDATDPEEIVNIARGYGAATLGTDNVGDPQVTGRIGGNAYTIFFYGCTDGRDCTNLQFSSGWISDDVDLAMINRWNREHRFSRAYLDDENDPIIEMDVNLEFGVSRRNFDDTFGVWSAILSSFANYVDP